MIKPHAILSSEPWNSWIFGLAWWRNRANQFSLKLALAGCMALFLAQVLALPQSVWSITTVLMLMLPMYVGAVAEKSLFRAIGTVIGGLLAVFIVGNFASTGPVLLMLSGLVIMVCIYFNGGTRAPYAFFLTALTMVIIIARTVQNPDSVWEVALFRVEEILLGIFCSLVMTALIWPRYARDDFAAQARKAMRELIRVQERLYGPSPVRIGDQPEASLVGLTLKMRGLIQLGGRESSYFRANSAVLLKIVNATSTLNQAMLEFASVRETNPGIELPAALLEGFFDSWHAVLLELAHETSKADGTSMISLRQSADHLDAYLEGMRDERQRDPGKIQEMLVAATLILLLDDIVRCTGQLFESLPLLPGDRGTFPQPSTKRLGSGVAIDVTWLKNGIRAGLAVAAALVFCDWIQPPGASLIPVFAFIFPVMSRTYLSSMGDLGVFTTLFRAAVFGIPWALFVFLISPLLTNYLWMNLFLGLCLFGFGRMVFAGLPALTLNSLLVLNGLISIFALNFQEPVTFFDVCGNYIGFVLGIGFAAVFQRLLWPVLPQREFRDRCSETLLIIQKLLQSPEAYQNLEIIRSEILRQISEINRWKETIPDALGGADEDGRRGQMVFLLRRLARVSLRTMELNRRLPVWPGVGRELEQCIEVIRASVAAQCGALANCFRNGRIPDVSQIAADKYPELGNFTGGIFSRNCPPGMAREDWLGWMSLLVRHRVLAERVDALANKMRKVDLRALGSDPVL